MRNLTRQQMIAIVAAAIVIITLIALGAGRFFGQEGELINELPDVDTSTSTDPNQAELDQPVEVVVPGTEALIDATFSDIQYLFVNQSIQKFAATHFPSTQGVQIETGTFARRTDREFGFSVTDKDGTHLFYVIATKLDNDKVKVDCYL
jgi:hypothetical protein